MVSRVSGPLAFLRAMQRGTFNGGIGERGPLGRLRAMQRGMFAGVITGDGPARRPRYAAGSIGATQLRTYRKWCRVRRCMGMTG